VCAILVVAVAACSSGGTGSVPEPGSVLASVVLGSIPARPSVVRPWVVSARFFSPRRGVVVLSPCMGEVCPHEAIMRTHDGGRHWDITGTAPRFSSTSFLSARVGYGVRAGCRDSRCRAVVSATRDGGRSWRPNGVVVRRFDPGPVSSGPAIVDFTTPTTGWLALDDTIEETSDGGATWRALPFRCPPRYELLASVSFTRAGRGDALCSWGQAATDMQGKELFTTANGGESWRLRAATRRGGALPIVGYGATIDLASPMRGYLTGERGGLVGTNDGWRSSRQLLFSDDEAIMTGTTWPTSTVGYVVAGGALLRTEDAGRSWSQVYPRPVTAPAATVTFVQPFSGRPGYGIAGQSTREGFLGGPTDVLRTTDGETWARVASLAGGPILTVTHDGATLYALAGESLRRPRLYRSTDGGLDWRLVAVVPPSRWLATAGGTFFLVSDDGGLLRSTDARHWSRVSRVRLWDVVFTSGREGVALDASTRIVATRDGGRTWTLLPHQPPLGNVEAIAALGTRVWAMASGGCGPRHCLGRLVWTPDRGRHWQAIRYPHTVDTEAGGLSFTTASVGWLESDGRTLRTTNGGRSWSEPRPARNVSYAAALEVGASTGSNIVLLDMGTGTRRPLITRSGAQTSPAWSPDAATCSSTRRQLPPVRPPSIGRFDSCAAPLADACKREFISYTVGLRRHGGRPVASPPCTRMAHNHRLAKTRPSRRTSGVRGARRPGWRRRGQGSPASPRRTR
jgi:photosystem II stability/assembly factor-like uncharacterized protein